MEWFSPEVFIAVFGSGGIAVTVLQKYGIINLPKRRIWSEQKRVDKMEQMTVCKDSFDVLFDRVLGLETDRTANKTMIGVHKELLKEIGEKLDKISDQTTATKISVQYLEKQEKKRNGGGV